MAKKVAKRAATVLLGVGLLAACSSGPSNNVSSPQPAAEQPPAAMPKAEGPRLFVSNEIDGTVSVIDTAQKKLIHTLKVGKRPRGIRTSADGRTVYVALSGSPIGGPNVDESKLPPPDRRLDGIGVIDAATGQLLRVLPGGNDPEQFALSTDGTRLFIANEDAGMTTVLDVTSGAIVKQIKVGGEPEGVDLSPDGKVVYVTSEEDNQVYAIDTDRLEVIKPIDVGPRPRSTGVLPDNSRGYVSSENGAALHIFDTRSFKVVHRLTFPSDALRPMGVIASADGTTVYVSTGRGGTVEAIDTKKNTVRASVRVGERPWGIALSADGKTIYTANGPSNDVSFVDTASMAVVATVKVGDRPWGVTVVP